MPKRIIPVILFITLLFTPALLSAQQQSDTALNDEKVMQAARAIFTLYIFGAAGMQKGQTPDGITFDKEANQFRFDEVDLGGLSDTYTTASGSITREAEDSLKFDFRLTGGPVSSIAYRIARDPEDPQGKSKPMNVVVNGTDYSFSTSEQD
jgi:hypothetical protein